MEISTYDKGKETNPILCFEIETKMIVCYVFKKKIHPVNKFAGLFWRVSDTKMQENVIGVKNSRLNLLWKADGRLRCLLERARLLEIKKQPRY